MASQTITALGNAIINLIDRKTPIATASTVGMVKPDGSTINIDANGVISSNGGGATRNIGEIVSSTVPLVDAGLHLLDGALIDGAGIYSDFVSYIADLYGDGTDVPSYFCSQADWETAVNTYGVCGKFVYNSTNGTVRLPKITGIVEGTTDVTALGDLVEAGLPNITGSFNSALNNYRDGSNIGGNGAFDGAAGYADSSESGSSGVRKTTITFNASLANSIYGNSTTVQPQTIKAFYYIVIATSTKTSIQVDIDEVATDLNGKVDKSDLSEVHCVVETYQNGTSWYRIYSDGWCEQGGQSTANTSVRTVNFVKPFVDTNYYASATKYGDYRGTNAIVSMIATKSTNSMEINNAGTDYPTCMWEAKGYII